MTVTRKDLEMAAGRFLTTFETQDGFDKLIISDDCGYYELKAIHVPGGGQRTILSGNTKKELFNTIHDVCNIAKKYKLRK